MMSTLLSDLENLSRRFKVLTDVETDKKFIHFVELIDNYQRKICGLDNEVCRLQEELVRSKRENNNLEMKLKNARQLVDLEKNKRSVVEKEKHELEVQISQVVNLLGNGNINENDTKETLQLLSNTLIGIGGTLIGIGNGSDAGKHSMKDILSPKNLSTINEDNDTLGSILTISDIDITEDDELEASRTRSGRTFRKSRDSQNRSVGKRKSSPGKNHSGTKKFHPYVEEDKENTLHDGNYEVNKKVLAMAHQRIMSYPSAPPISSDDNISDDPGGQNHLPLTRNSISTPIVNNHHPVFTKIQVTTPGGGALYSSPSNSPILRNYSTSKMNARPHCFISKKIYWTEFCQPCGKRIKFAKAALKCRDCRATCHSDCKDAVPLPCVLTATTPGNKGQMGIISDYTPRIPPMVPAIVVHCTNEVENRGLNEVGLYRVPGSASQVKELKEAFLQGRGTPNLSKVEIHVVCGILKDFLRSLKEPLITRTLWRDFVNSAEKCEQQDMQAALYQAISDLPQPNRDTLAWVINHLQRVAECAECKMPATNLAKVFGPTIVGYSVAEPEAITVYDETRQQQKVMEKLLDISNDYWRTYIYVFDDSSSVSKFITPEKGNTMGAYPSSNTRRRSILSLTPFSSRDCNTPRRCNTRV